MKEVDLLVTAETNDLNRLKDRIKTLDRVDSVLEFKEPTPPSFDIGVTCGHGVPRHVVEELLLGVGNVKVEVLR